MYTYSLFPLSRRPITLRYYFRHSITMKSNTTIFSMGESSWIMTPTTERRTSQVIFTYLWSGQIHPSRTTWFHNIMPPSLLSLFCGLRAPVVASIPSIFLSVCYLFLRPAHFHFCNYITSVIFPYTFYSLCPSSFYQTIILPFFSALHAVSVSRYLLASMFPMPVERID